MNYGYNMAASGVITAMFRQDVAANNLANIETVGFKPDIAFTIPREAARVEDKLYNLPSNKLLERLGAGVLLAPTRTAHAQGTLTRTGNQLDLAIKGDGFFTVGGGHSGASGQQVRLTRDGRLTLNAQGELVTVTGGHAVLDDAGRPITVGAGGTIDIDEDGTIHKNGGQVAKIRLVAVPDKRQLRKLGDNLYAASSAALDSKGEASGAILQNHIEQSAVDPIRAMMAVQSAANDVASATKAMTVHNDLVGRMISSLGRVSG